MNRAYSRNRVAWLAAIMALALAACTPSTPVDDTPDLAAGDGADEGASFRIEQPVATTYEPGGAYHATVTMHYTGDEPVTALAIRIRPPAGWQYGGVTGDLRPAIEPAAGAQDELTMVWIQIPAFPATLEYVLDVPANPTGPGVLSVDAVYRTLGGELYSPVSEVTLSAAGL